MDQSSPQAELAHLGLVPETRRVGYNACVPVTADPVTSKILIVDDDESVTQTFASMLRLEGYQVRTAITAENGLRVAEESRPDAIILDLRMPLVDGLGFLRRLRARAASGRDIAR